jgi:hypothetical protein
VGLARRLRRTLLVKMKTSFLSDGGPSPHAKVQNISVWAITARLSGERTDLDHTLHPSCNYLAGGLQKARMPISVIEMWGLLVPPLPIFLYSSDPDLPHAPPLLSS